MPTDLDRPAWIPPGAAVRWVHVGDAGWHAVSVPLITGATVLTALGDDTGAIIQDDGGRQMTWLIRPGAADTYRLPADAIVVREPSRLHVPGLDRGDGIWWCLPPTGGRPALTPMPALAAALAAATAGRRPR
ncbi:hypothetical protein AB0F42_24550 [Streptomyces buecherae]|uniref:hypothetical protein n=1 Tax=Streptomyces buecherae TaxID=2763006 RepID=UPI003410BD7A